MGGAERSAMRREGTKHGTGRCAVWGILNVTPDSFSDGGDFLDHGRALRHAQDLVAAGADVIDVGGESSRPAGTTYGEGARGVEVAEELRRVLPVVERLSAEGIAVSVDTTKGAVAQAALGAGARYVNDVRAGADATLLEVVARYDAELVLMHNRGRGEVGGANIDYGGDVVGAVLRELQHAIDRAARAGVETAKIWIDPGIGFAKTPEQSAAVLDGVDALVATGHRVLVGASRKSFIGALAPDADGRRPTARERLGGSLAAVTLAVMRGAHAVRVHDVRETHQAVRLMEAMAREVRP